MKKKSTAKKVLLTILGVLLALVIVLVFGISASVVYGLILLLLGQG